MVLGVLVGVWKTQFTGIAINIVSLRKIEGPVWHVYFLNILFILIYLLVLERFGSLSLLTNQWKKGIYDSMIGIEWAFCAVNWVKFLQLTIG